MACLLTTLAICVCSAAARAQTEHREMEETLVWGHSRDSSSASYTNPTSLLRPNDVVGINVATTEDLVKYEPNLVIRRRFIGDANGVLGIRGSNMFQTSRSMVFADGVPLHYLLQSRWNGAPRWTMVSASEIAQVETIYGPFSAEYSGNSIGGVVLIETAIPQKREFHFDTSVFSQSFDDYGFDDEVSGYKTFLSYGDRIGDASIYLSYNRLENDSQPQTFYTAGPDSGADTRLASGAIPGVDSRGRESLYFGDTGVVNTTTNNFKVKLGYDFERWSTLLNIAYEDRSAVADSANSYVRDTAGDIVYSGSFVQNGEAFSIPGSRLNASELDRESLSVGLRVRAEVSDSIAAELNVSVFDILQDEERSSTLNPNDPDYTSAGEVAVFDDTGWRSTGLKFRIDPAGLESVSLITGLRYESYQLNLDIYDSDNWSSGSQDALTASSGGKTAISAAFLQANWALSERWDAAVGGRYESFKSRDGYFADDNTATPELQLTETRDTSREQFSPKFSVGYRPAGDAWQLRYSFGRAYRFPIVEELFSQFKAFNAESIANPELRPEDATTHNLMIDRSVAGGYVRLNLFTENVEDVIESQATTLPGGISIRTFVPIDEVQTRGVEFIVNQRGFFADKLDVRFNLAYTDSEILHNDANPGIEGNRYPRMPKWRGNLMATYHLTPQWDIGASVQYASNSFGRSDNTDTANQVYGAQDGFTRIGAKTSWQINKAFTLSLGVDNLSNEIAYVAHPWPGRTWYGSLSYDL